jgi:hypothetical protein
MPTPHLILYTQTVPTIDFTDLFYYPKRLKKRNLYAFNIFLHNKPIRFLKTL